jgi:[protein-PII] uridylyltransferase
VDLKGFSSMDGAVGGAQADTVLAEQRRLIGERVLAGASGGEIFSAMTDLVDALILERCDKAVRHGGEVVAEAGLRQCCVVALGGYGRRELAPYSDIDLMFLFRSGAKDAVEAFVRAVLHPLWDRGFQVGHSVRTLTDSIELARADSTVKTSMMEARFLAGNSALFQEFRQQYLRKIVAEDVDGFLDRKLEERRREYERFGETVYLLEPNVKKSKGGLRDLHLLQWAGMVRYQAGTIRELCTRGILSRTDYEALAAAQEFLWRVRVLLHVHAGAAQEILSFDEQVWLARHFGYQDRAHVLAVEQFMQQYYQHTMGLHERCRRFVERCRSVSLWSRLTAWLPTPRLDQYFVARTGIVTVAEEYRVKVLEEPALLLRLFDLAREKDLVIAPSLLDDIHRRVGHAVAGGFDQAEVGRLFMRIMAGPRTATTLEAMHRAHLLEKLVPPMGTVRGLMQFNQYHKYTVDEHSLLAVGRVEALAQDPGVLGDAYRRVKRKDILHLAVLMHDLGKGQPGDHSEVGRKQAEQVGLRLGLDEQGLRTLTTLVHRHLLMAHTAFRRDVADDNVVVRFAREVGAPEVLNKLVALTAADIAAVGPGVLSKWKESLLIALYGRTMPELSGDREAREKPERWIQLAEEVSGQPGLRTQDGVDRAWVEAELRQFPDRYLTGTPPERMAAHLSAVRRLGPDDVIVEAEVRFDLGTCEYAVIAHHSLTPGIFSKIAGVMAGSGLQILDAQILTRADGIVVDIFQVTDPDFQGEPPLDRRHTVGEHIAAVLRGQEQVDDILRRGARVTLTHPLPKAREATEVWIDNETADGFTIIDVFADDRRGLLYVITSAMLALGLSIHAARVSTKLDQACDVFYVTDQSGRKIQDQVRLERVRTEIEGAIETFFEAKAA